MRHRKKKIQINKSKGHTKSLVRNLLTSLFEHGRVKTTERKAKILKSEAEKLIARSKKRETVHAIRKAGEVFFKKDVAKKFFQEYLPLAEKRKSGFVRLYKLGNRNGDNAPVVLVELIDMVEAPKTASKATTTTTKEVKEKPKAEKATEKKPAKKATPKAKKAEPKTKKAAAAK